MKHWTQMLAVEAVRQARADLIVVRVLVGWQFIISIHDGVWTVKAHALRCAAHLMTPRQVRLFLVNIARAAKAPVDVHLGIPDQPQDRVTLMWRTEHVA